MKAKMTSAKSNRTRSKGAKADTLISASLELPKLIDGWFKAGRYPLVSVGIGATLTFIYVSTLNNTVSKGAKLPLIMDLCFYLGTVLLLGGFAAAMIAGVYVQKTLKKGIKQYDTTIKTAQEFSKESVEAIRNLNELLAVHVNTVAQVIDAAKPILSMFGGVSFANSRYLGSDLAAFSNNAQRIIEDVERAITEADFKALLQYRDEISKLVIATREIVQRVKNGDIATQQVAEFTQSIQSARQAASAYSESATKIFDRVSATAAPIIGMCQVARKIPVVGSWLQNEGIVGHIEALESLQKLMLSAQNANLAVSKAIEAPNKDSLDAALLHMQFLRAALAGKVLTSTSVGDASLP